MCASVFALGALALTADGAFAATTVKGTKSNSDYKLDAGAAAAKKCTDAGGKVYTDAAGNKLCVMPGAVTTINGSKSNGDSRTTAITEKQCTDKGGSVLTDAAGDKICLMPETAAAPAAH